MLSRSTPVIDPLGSFVVEVFRLNGALLAEGDRITGDLGLSSARWQVLGAIELSGRPLSVSQIARNMGLTRQSVQRIANELMADGLIDFRDNPDHQRAKLVVLTTPGHDAFRAAMRRQSVWGKSLLRSTGVAEKRLAQATTMLRLLRQKLTEKKK